MTILNGNHKALTTELLHFAHEIERGHTDPVQSVLEAVQSVQVDLQCCFGGSKRRLLTLAQRIVGSNHRPGMVGQNP